LNLSLIWRRHHCRWRAAKCSLCSALRAFEQEGIFIVPHLLWHGPSVFPVSSEGPSHSIASSDTRKVMLRTCSNAEPKGSLFSRVLLHARGMLKTYCNTDPIGSSFSRIVWHERGCGGPILTQNLTGPHSFDSYNMQEDAANPFYPRSARVDYTKMTKQSPENDNCSVEAYSGTLNSWSALWLIYWLFTVSCPARESFNHMETSPSVAKGCKFTPMLVALGLWAWRNLYRATSHVTRDLRFFGVIRRTTPFSRLIRHARGS
jgi:hypothetical protein